MSRMWGDVLARGYFDLCAFALQERCTQHSFNVENLSPTTNTTIPIPPEKPPLEAVKQTG